MSTFEDWLRIADSVGARRGWDFSPMRDALDPVPWDYIEVVRRYLQPDSHVLDIGTGGGEKLLSLAPHFGSGVGIDVDPGMVLAAQDNMVRSQTGNVAFKEMCAERLRFTDASFDVVLNRHSTLRVSEIVRVLRPGGHFLTQQVGARNTQNICALFGCTVGGKYQVDQQDDVKSAKQAFEELDCRVTCQAEYDVRYWFLDVESLVFWHKAIPMPEDFDISAHWRQLEHIVTRYRTQNGIETNEHRELLIARKA